MPVQSGGRVKVVVKGLTAKEVTTVGVGDEDAVDILVDTSSVFSPLLSAGSDDIDVVPRRTRDDV